MCPSYLATRDEKDSTRGSRTGAAGDGQRHPGHRRLAGARGPRVARPLPGLQGLLVGLPDRRRHGDVQGRGPAPGVPRPAAPGQPLQPRLAAPVGPTGVEGAASGQRRARQPRSAGLGKRLAGVDRAPRPATVRHAVRSGGGSPTTRARPASRCCSGSTRSPTTSRRRSGIAAVAVLERAGFSVRIPAGDVCCGLTWISTGQLDARRARCSAGA